MPRTLPSVTRSLGASLLGAGWIAVLRLLMIPVYVRLLGVEAYGLVGFYVAVQATLQVLDLGLSTTMSRQIARYSATADGATARNFVRTVATGYWLLGAILGLTIAMAAPAIAADWLRTSTLPQPVVRQAVTLMGVAVALEWPLTIYQGGLLGLQRIVALSTLNAAMATVVAGGALVALVFVSPTVTTLFFWFAIASALHTLLAMMLLWHSLPAGPARPRIDPALLRGVWRFAAGVTAIMLTATVLSQIDKLLLSRLLPLEQLGYYTIASVAATGISAVVTPVFNVLFPRFSALVTTGATLQLRQLYHAGMQLLATLVAPLATLMIFFAPELLLAWTQNPLVTSAAAPLLRFLAFGTALSGLMFLPYAVQLAHAWTRLYLSVHVCFILVLAPLVTVLAPRYGSIVPAIAWAALNVVWLVVALPATHHRYLSGATRLWFTQDVLPPVLASLVPAVIGRGWMDLTVRTGAPSWTALASVVVCTAAASVIAGRCTRQWIMARVARLPGLRRIAPRT